MYGWKGSGGGTKWETEEEFITKIIEYVLYNIYVFLIFKTYCQHTVLKKAKQVIKWQSD